MRQITFLGLISLALVIMPFKVPSMYSGTAQEAKFTDVSQSAGVKISQPTYGNPIWGDFDNDGNLDLFIINHWALPSLFHNNGNETFTNVQPASGISSNGDRHGAAMGDYDNDGDLDLFITLGAARGNALGGKTDQLYRNDGGGIFTDVTAFAGVDNASGRGRSINWVDFNNDGYLDLFVKNFNTPNVLYRNNRDGTFTDVALATGIENAPGAISSWADFDGDGDMDLFITSGAKDHLWRNNGDDTFTKVSSLAGLPELSYGQGVAWGDYDNDGKIDLYIARGYYDVRNSLLWSSTQILFSDEESEENGIDFHISGNEVTFDLYLKKCRQANKVFIGSQSISPEQIPITILDSQASNKPAYSIGQQVGFFIWRDNNGWHIRWNSDGLVNYFYGKITTNSEFTSVQYVNSNLKIPTIMSTLYKNNGDGTFIDVTKSSRIESNNNNRGAIWGDYNNDGYLDLYVVNSGTIEANAPNMLYRNNGNGTFTKVTEISEVLANVDGRGDGASWGDYNNDGFLDLSVTNGWERPILKRKGDGNCLVHGPHLLYKNNGNSNHWVKVRLVGIVSNRDAIGAKVKLIAGGKTQFREVNGGGGGYFFSQGSSMVHFGLGQVNIIDSLTIRWPSGIKQVLKNIHSDQVIPVVEQQ